MRQVLSTALVALIVGAIAGGTMGALAQSEPAQTEPAPEQAIVPTATVANADKVDGKHAVSATGKRGRRAGKLVATNKSGWLPSNIVKPYWQLIRNKPASFADGKITWNEVADKPGGFADGVDDKGVTSLLVTRLHHSQPIGPATGTILGIVESPPCPVGSVVIGGGHFANTYGLNNLSSSPVKNFWRASFAGNVPEERDITAYVYCLSVQGGSISADASGR